MQKKHWIALTLVIAALATLLASGKPGKPGKPVPVPRDAGSICSETKDKSCGKKKKPGLLLEGMSRQFIIITPITP